MTVMSAGVEPQEREAALASNEGDGACGFLLDMGCRLTARARQSVARLDHLARLVVSLRLIGCRPGRPERVQRLAVPECIKDLINFKDVTL